MTDIAELKRRAEAARELSADHQTPGVWMYLFGDRFVYTRLEDGCRGRTVVGVDFVDRRASKTYLSYVACADPSTILSLISRIEQLEAENARLREAVNSIVDFHNLPLEVKRPDIWQRVLSRAAKALETP